jgi:hypothetical protein
MERRTYRKSPGRQYEADPLRSRSGASQSGAGGNSRSGERGSPRETVSRSGTQSLQRPDPRRTRQLLRKNIIAGKSPQTSGELDEAQEIVDEQYLEDIVEEERYPSRQSGPRGVAGQRGGRSVPTSSRIPSTRELLEADEEDGAWEAFDAQVDLDDGYEESFEGEPDYGEVPPRSRMLPSAPIRRAGAPLPAQRQAIQPAYEEDYEDEYDEEEDEEPRRGKRKKKVSRRGLLLGLGTAVVLGGAAGAGVAAHELGPKLPQAIGNVGSNIEHQLEEAFQKGLTQGADNARKEMLTALGNLEGFTLDSAINAAKLTRVAYDVFVSPVVNFGSAVAVDFLTSMSRAFKSARGILANVGQDNSTLQAIQSVLDNWVSQITKMPKQLDAITGADLDGAQAYLHALQRKIQEEQAKLQNSNGTSSSGTPSVPSK